MKGMTDMDELVRRKQLSDGQQYSGMNYGYVPENPVMVDSEESEKEYLSMLRIDNAPITNRKKIGELCLPILHGVENVSVSGYQLYAGEKQYKILYICHEGNNTGYCPYGLSLVRKTETIREKPVSVSQPVSTAATVRATPTGTPATSAPVKPPVTAQPARNPDIIVDRRINPSSPPRNTRCSVCNSWISASDRACPVCGTVLKAESVYNKGQREPKRSPWKVFLAIMAVLLLFCMAFFPSVTASKTAGKAKTTATPKVTAKPTAVPTATPKPVTLSNGKKFIIPSYECICPFTVETKTDSGTVGDYYYYVYLKYKGASKKSKDDREKKSGLAGYGNESDIAFCVKAGRSIKIDVPIGKYELYYATGTTFYGTKYLFGSRTVCTKADTILEFYTDGKYYQGHTVTLYKVENGNMSTREIDESQFPTR